MASPRRQRKSLEAAAPPPHYETWLAEIFDHPVDVNPNCEYDNQLSFAVDEAGQAELLAYTLENCARDLAGFSDLQVSAGLRCFFCPGSADIVCDIASDSVPIALRLRVIAAIKTLYRDCFEPRCAPALGSRNEEGNPLNEICYMLWDITPVLLWGREPSEQIFQQAVLDVLEDALVSPNPACVESALHGLGHIQHDCKADVSRIVSAYLRRNVFAASGLQSYARLAAEGRVQ